MTEFNVTLLAFHALPGERAVPLFAKQITINCETWEEADLIVADMVGHPILVAGSARSSNQENLAKLHRSFHFPVPPEECIWSEDPKDPLAFQLKGIDAGDLSGTNTEEESK